MLKSCHPSEEVFQEMAAMTRTFLSSAVSLFLCSVSQSDFNCNKLIFFFLKKLLSSCYFHTHLLREPAIDWALGQSVAVIAGSPWTHPESRTSDF